MSPGNFARVFRAEVGMTPAAYVEQLRVERARSLLEAGEKPVESIAEVRLRHGRDATTGLSARRGVSPVNTASASQAG